MEEQIIEAVRPHSFDAWCRTSLHSNHTEQQTLSFLTHTRLK
jgi:hypothetical protein